MTIRPRPSWFAGAAAAAAVLGVYTAQGVQYRRESGIGLALDEAPPPGSGEFARLVEAWCGGPLRQGNRVDVLRNGAEIFPSMLDALRAAEHTIDFSNYIFWGGGILEEFFEVLVERAKAGVDVNVLADGWGSAYMDRDLADRLEEAGGRFVWFRTPRAYTVDKLNNRSHRRILVVDGRVGFSGGLGVADPWQGDAERPGRWRETHLRIEGPAVLDLFGAFADHWVEETGEVLAGAHLPELSPFDDGVPVQVAKSAAVEGRAAAEALAYLAIRAARERLWFTTAYFAPRQTIVDALAEAAERGVDVRVIVNGPDIDKEVVRKAGQRSYGRLLQAGVRIFEYHQTMMHAKVMLADDCWSNVGTANFDNRSLALQEEINCSVYDQAINAELEKHFLEDFDGSEEMDLDGWRRRPLRSRVYEAVSETLRHSL